MAGKMQVAALPWRMGEQGVEVLLITTRTTHRWVIPKGWPMPDRADHAAAEQEAMEEAGLTGQISALPYGRFGYVKQSANGKTRLVTVTVFLLEVTGAAEDWRERGQRERRWMAPEAAAAAAGEPELALLLSAFARDVAAGKIIPHRPEPSTPPPVWPWHPMAWGLGLVQRLQKWLVGT